MAVRIELWISQALVGGAEGWWDDVEARLPEPDLATREYPVLSRVDPYDDVVIPESDFPQLITDLQRCAVNASPPLTEFLNTLVSLAEQGLLSESAELRFLGD
jgi:hypothetical protein